jgi:hypothetical protein
VVFAAHAVMETILFWSILDIEVTVLAMSSFRISQIKTYCPLLFFIFNAFICDIVSASFFAILVLTIISSVPLKILVVSNQSTASLKNDET